MGFIGQFSSVFYFHFLIGITFTALMILYLAEIAYIQLNNCILTKVAPQYPLRYYERMKNIIEAASLLSYDVSFFFLNQKKKLTRLRCFSL